MSGDTDELASWIRLAENHRREAERLREVVRQWGRVLLAEGRLTVNDVRNAMYDADQPIAKVQSHPVLDDLLGRT